MPFTLVHAGKYGTEDKLKYRQYKNSQPRKKQTTQNTAKQKQPGLVASYDTRPGNEVGLFYNATEPLSTKLSLKSDSQHSDVMQG